MSPTVVVVGNLAVDLVLGPVDGLPAWGTEQVVETMDYRTAGSAGYCALALAHLGLPANVVSRVGRDLFGDLVLADLRDAGIDVEELARYRSERPTSVSYGFTAPHKDRAFLTFLGALADVGPASILANSSDWKPARHLMLCGLNLLPGLVGERDGVRRVLSEARAQGMKTWLDTGWPVEGWHRGFRDLILGLLPLVDFLMPNEVEAAKLAGLDGAEPTECARWLHGRGAATVIVKLGGEGAVAVGEAGQVHVPARDVRVQDTVGAGDVFNAGVMYGVGEGRSMRESLELGVALSAQAIRGVEPRYARIDQIGS